MRRGEGEKEGGGEVGKREDGKGGRRVKRRGWMGWEKRREEEKQEEGEDG